MKRISTRTAEHPRPVIVSHDDVELTGEALDEPLLYQGRQWAVTGYGLEARDGTYAIPRKRLRRAAARCDWAAHMAEKDWVDMRDFKAAIAWARDYFAPARRVKKARAAPREPSADRTPPSCADGARPHGIETVSVRRLVFAKAGGSLAEMNVSMPRVRFLEDPPTEIAT